MQLGRFRVDLSRPRVMGIINLTPDSFSDGGLYSKDLATSLKQAEMLVQEGADILDVGGESSRPGAGYVSPEDEWERVRPFLAEVSTWKIPISLDTRRSFVMREALNTGYVDIINDIEALKDAGATSILAEFPDVAVVLMHMLGEPQTMQHNPHYEDVVTEVIAFLQARIDACTDAGISRERLIVDPGIGFGKTPRDNLTLIRDLSRFEEELDCPVLLGVSRKSLFLATAGEKEPRARIGSGVVAEVEGVRRGARIIRTHDVRQSRGGILTYLALNDDYDKY